MACMEEDCDCGALGSALSKALDLELGPFSDAYEPYICGDPDCEMCGEGRFRMGEDEDPALEYLAEDAEELVYDLLYGVDPRNSKYDDYFEPRGPGVLPTRSRRLRRRRNRTRVRY